MTLTDIHHQTQLGKNTEYDPHYNPDKLVAVSRNRQRIELGIHHPLPFYGVDQWTHYEVSWLNEQGKPMVALAEISYPCDSPYLIESKSMKLYFNSFNNTPFSDLKSVQQHAMYDISKKIQADAKVEIIPIDQFNRERVIHFDGDCLDHLDVSCHVYTVDSSLLTTEHEYVHETLYSNLLKSNCLVTNQPDWGSVQIIYQGRKMNHAGLLQYIVSYRNHNEFGEHCIERIFTDIMKCCQPDELTVYGRYTRRGGLDINPFRSTKKEMLVMNHIQCRQ